VAEPEPAPTAPTGSLGIADVRRLWPGVLDRVKEARRFTWIMLNQNANVVALDGNVLTIGLVNSGARDSFDASGSAAVLSQALQDVLGVAWTIDAVIDPSASGSEAAPAPAATGSVAAQASQPRGRGVPDSVRQAADGKPAAEEDPDAAAHPDDPTIDSDLDPEQLLASELGAQVIDEKS
jgi:DNA polymerase-3 subunit gamma/tau